MKLSISVPDSLWKSVNPGEDSPSEVVQRALRLLEGQQKADDKPLAGAPDQSDLDRYRPAFEEAVSRIEALLRRSLDTGYRFGLFIAPDMELDDFPVLDGPDVASDVRELLEVAGDPDRTGRPGADRWTEAFVLNVEAILFPETGVLEPDDEEGWELLMQGRRIIGEEFLGQHDGAKFEGKDGKERLQVTDPFVHGVTAALKDVRDETLRRVGNLEIAPSPEEAS